MTLLHSLTFESPSVKKRGKQKKVLNVNGVLADEMGLGKTVQTIVFLAWLKHRTHSRTLPKTIRLGEKGKNNANTTDHNSDENDDTSQKISKKAKPHLIIVPASVLNNWMREFEKFCPTMVVVKYHGSMLERVELQKKLRNSLPTAPKQLREPLDIVLTTYSYFSAEKSDDRNFLKKFNFDYMVVDEAHCLKNPKGLRYRKMDQFSTDHRLLLTGTPVQNSPQELMSLLCFLMPLFSSRSNADSFDGEDMENDGGLHMLDQFVTLEQNNNKVTGTVKTTSSGRSAEDNRNAYRKLKQLLGPFVLRRRKSDVLKQLIPPKTKRVEFVPFDDATRNVYQSILSSHVEAVKNRKDTVARQKNLFCELRKAANHQLLLRSRHNTLSEIDELSKLLFSLGYFGRNSTCTLHLVKKEISKFSDYDIHCAALELMDEYPSSQKVLKKFTLKEDDMYCSPKFVRLRTLLPELIKEKHRVLIFSQWTRCLDLLGCFLDSIEMDYLRLDGQTAIPDRQMLIDRYNNDESIPVFLLSTRAGGMGINLTAADTCILHDLDFNPFNDLQAEDRCHRIGQTKPVTVIKMVTQDTVDEGIYAMQERKAEMNAAIMESGEKENSSKDMKLIVQNALDNFKSLS